MFHPPLNLIQSLNYVKSIVFLILGRLACRVARSGGGRAGRVARLSDGVLGAASCWPGRGGRGSTGRLVLPPAQEPRPPPLTAGGGDGPRGAQGRPHLPRGPRRVAGRPRPRPPGQLFLPRHAHGRRQRKQRIRRTTQRET